LKRQHADQQQLTRQTKDSRLSTSREGSAARPKAKPASFLVHPPKDLEQGAAALPLSPAASTLCALDDLRERRDRAEDGPKQASRPCPISRKSLTEPKAAVQASVDALPM